MSQSASLSIPKRQERQLKEAALRIGFSPDALLRRIIADTTQSLLEIPEESLDEYEHPEEIVRAFRDALRAEREGKLLSTLPRSRKRTRQ